MKNNFKIVFLIICAFTTVILFPLFLFKFCLLFFPPYKYNPYYEAADIKDILQLNGEWQYFQLIYPEELGPGAVEAFGEEWQWNLVNERPYRIRVENKILLAYDAYPILRYNALYYLGQTVELWKISEDPHSPKIKEYFNKCDISDKFSFLPLKYCEFEGNIISDGKYERTRRENGKINTSMLNIDESYIEAYCDNRLYIITHPYAPFFIYFENQVENSELLAAIRVPFNKDWRATCHKIESHIPSANDPIIFHDELDKVDASKIEVLAIAGENLTELPEKLKECVSLKKLFIPFNKLRFTERDMEILISLKNLEVLDIRYNEIANSPDPNLNALKELKNLRKVYLAGKNFGKDDYIPTVFAEMNLDLLAISNGYDIKFPDEYARSNSPKRINILYSVLSESEVKRSKIKSSKNRTWSLVESYIIPDKDIKLPQAN